MENKKNIVGKIGGGVLIVISLFIILVSIKMGGILGGIIGAIIASALMNLAKSINPQAGVKMLGNVKNGGTIAILVFLVALMVVFILASK